MVRAIADPPFRLGRLDIAAALPVVCFTWPSPVNPPGLNLT
jgi:hypothetical protein